MQARTATPLTLRIIRIAMLAGLLLFGGVTWWLHSTGNAPAPFDPAFARTLQLVFFAMCVSFAAAIMLLRSVRSRTSGPRVVTLSLLAYALGEGIAIFGAVYWLFTGAPALYAAGLAIFLLALLLLPVPEEEVLAGA